MKVDEMIVTWEEALAEQEAKGWFRGRIEGAAAGRVEGEIRAKQDDLLLVAQHRFGDLPSGFEDEIRGISDLGRLNALFEQIPRSNSLNELGAKLGSSQH